MTVQTSKVHTIFFTVCWSSSSLFVLFLWVQRIYSCLPDVIHDGILAKEKRHAQSSFPTFYMAYMVWLFHPITSQDKIFQQTRPSTHPPVHPSIFYHLSGVGSPGSSLGFLFQATLLMVPRHHNPQHVTIGDGRNVDQLINHHDRPIQSLHHRKC